MTMVIKMPKSISSAVFKATCLQLMDEVKEKHIQIIVTKHGKPVAQLVPLEDDSLPEFFGCLKDTVVIKGDIVNPIDETWEANE